MTTEGRQDKQGQCEEFLTCSETRTMRNVMIVLFATLLPVVCGSSSPSQDLTPFVLATWDYPGAVDKAWRTISQVGKSALDAVESGITYCELNQCRGSVGFGNHPDENGEPTLDALIMDGPTHDAGAVGCLRNVKTAISVARRVLQNTEITLLVGNLATDFAQKMGFKMESLVTNDSDNAHRSWKEDNCQPNYWKNVEPNPRQSCGPYSPSPGVCEGATITKDRDNHDTIGMIVMDKNGHLSVGTSTNGLNHKIPGRVGDSPVVGSGGYVDQEVGAAAATGDGDVMMRFLPSYQAVESMRQGLSPQDAATDAIARIHRKYPKFQGAVIAGNLTGHFGIACAGWHLFPYTFANMGHPQSTIITVKCVCDSS